MICKHCILKSRETCFFCRLKEDGGAAVLTKSEMRDVYTESVLPGGVVFVYVQPDLHFENIHIWEDSNLSIGGKWDGICRK